MKRSTLLSLGFVSLSAASLAAALWWTKAEAAGRERAAVAETRIIVSRLAQIPATALNVSLLPLEVEDSSRYAFSGSFFDSHENIARWLRSSPGVRKGERVGESRYALRTGSGVQVGEVMVLSGQLPKVIFRIWAS